MVGFTACLLILSVFQFIIPQPSTFSSSHPASQSLDKAEGDGG